MRNPFYCGYISSKLLDGEIVKGKHPALISEELFLKVNKLITGKTGYKWSKDDEQAPMRRFMICTECGVLFTGYSRTKN